MSDLQALKLTPVFLSDQNGQPAWAVLSFEQYQQLLNAAGMKAASQSQPHSQIQAQAVPPGEPLLELLQESNATAKLLASLAESAKAGADLNSLKFDAGTFKAKRLAVSMSIEDLARSAGISPSYALMIESGEREPSAAIVNNFVRALDLS